jgi:hypothetical protein
VETRDGEATEDDNLKASDADRQQVADRLGTAVGEGRLTLQEYRDRAAVPREPTVSSTDWSPICRPHAGAATLLATTSSWNNPKHDCSSR